MVILKQFQYKWTHQDESVIKEKEKTWFSENNSSKNDSDEVLDIMSEYELLWLLFTYFFRKCENVQC